MLYLPDEVPDNYDSEWLYAELRKIAQALEFIEAPRIRLAPQNVLPIKPREGDVANADGTNWNPGAGAGLYEYIGGSWNKL